MSGKVLLVEDEHKIARVLELELRHEGYEVTLARNGPDGLELARGGSWDVILLNIMLPGITGLDVLKQIRETNRTVPVILLTARDTVPDKVNGLDLGANDYMTKPFAIEELMARIRGLIRTSRVQSREDEDVYRVGDLSLDAKSRTVKRGEEPIELTPREFELLLYFMKHPGEVLSREHILSDVWGYDFAGDTNLVDVYVRYLRQKIDEGFKTKLIQTSRGVGYYLKHPQPEGKPT
ncbi:response regulator transcription factor [Paenibacillus hodogayensis]|uniref:Response regulator transcription factor n=1 Tax=Paenibacillus hodogayensis TaxID=279208 RepID=A0ABV5W4E6_9BACL